MAPEAARFSLLGGSYFLGGPAEFLDWLLERGRGGRAVCVANVHSAVSALWDGDLARAQRLASLSVPDGRPLSLAGKLLGAWEARQLRGPDLMLWAAQGGRPKGIRHYYFGGAPGIAAAAAKNLMRAAPGMKLAGAESPPFRELKDAELKALAARLKRSRADLLWIGLGAPRQEKLMARLLGLGLGCTMLGVGAGFDIHAGAKRQAPRWMQALALEWAFRLFSEPGRVFRRYLATNPLFPCLLLAEHFGLYPASRQGWTERLLRAACLPPFLGALAQGRPWAALAAAALPAWLGRMFFLFLSKEPD